MGMGRVTEGWMDHRCFFLQVISNTDETEARRVLLYMYIYIYMYMYHDPVVIG